MYEVTSGQLIKLLEGATSDEWTPNDYDAASDEIVITSKDGYYITSIDCDGCFDADEGQGSIMLANAELIALAPLLARRVLVAEKLAAVLRASRASFASLGFTDDVILTGRIDRVLSEYGSIE